MPFRSLKQQRAMFAAAAGKSTIGIPQEVGQKYVQDSTAKKDESTKKMEKFMQNTAMLRKLKEKDPHRLYELVKRRAKERSQQDSSRRN